MKSLIKFPKEVSDFLALASDETAGAVFKAIMQYVATGAEPENLAPDVLCIFKFATLYIKLPKKKEIKAYTKPEPAEASAPEAQIADTPQPDPVPIEAPAAISPQTPPKKPKQPLPRPKPHYFSGIVERKQALNQKKLQRNYTRVRKARSAS